MLETCGQLMNFLNQAGLMKSLKAFQDDMEIYIQSQQQQKTQNENNPQDGEKQTNSNLLKIIKKAIHQNNKKDVIPTFNQGAQDFQNKVQNINQKLFSQEETEQIMERLMNKLVASPGLLEDEKLNSKIEKFFDNQTFQRMVEATDVMQDISNLSFTNSFLQKTKQEQQSILDENPPHFGMKQQPMNAPGLANQDFKLDQFNQQTISNQTNQQHNQLQQQQNVQNQQTDMNNGSEHMPLYPQQLQMNSPHNNQSDLNQKSEKQTEELKETQNKLEQLQNQDVQADAQNDLLQGILLQEDFMPNIDEYTDDDDPGFDLYEVPQKDFVRVAQQLAEKSDFPARAVSSIPKKEGYDPHKEYSNPFANANPNQEDSQAMIKDIQKQSSSQAVDDQQQQKIVQQKNQVSKASIFLPDHIKFPQSNDSFYPIKYDKVIYDAFNLKVIFDRERTGFEETKEFPIVINSIIAGRYQVMEYLGSAAFSKAIQCLDLVTNRVMCMKIIENNKDYFDQSIDEIKLLRYINYNGDVDEKNVLRYFDYFYHKEHLFIITELLEENLYEFYKFNRENEQQRYFTVGRLQKITQQILVALDFIHSLRLIHCDLKPENILMKSKPKGEVKVIDFGSSCFIHDHLSSYVQSRSYRAPEVIIGCKYDYRIDIWSLGCILAELWTGNVLFQNDNIQGLLARVIGIIGPFPEWMMKEGRLVQNFFTREKLLYMEVFEEADQSQAIGDQQDGQRQKIKTGKIQILVPKHSNLKARLRTEDHLFIDFVRQCLQIDFTRRPTAKEALSHPWFKLKYPDGL
ncbi:Serine/Threonine kinase domain protein (macronuclear) [Tetrahymena thermophila SB210]|uniref:Serine/Threonine kinase domain protein n=1 Tax=Tetrahymena thermophila (strain SB210) TaxID=312017 RepID=I7M2H9_TETTS|nr:Serine/Threonine kinase domain protein [Tetrahymena thermophila SB210]EAS00422.2 Serine/Threonine kinase domain protein [Tetrahymena thermophila SB210]|eukprot:XP_001020667.2 Serine/Threonine kinase domain protein [Tetrahymena thermophila SB210]